MTGTLGEEGLYGFLTTVSKGRVAEVMCKTGCRDDLSYLLKQCVLQFGTLAADNALGNVIAKRHAHAGHFQRVCQTVVYEDASRQWEYLRLVLQPAKRCRENQSVVVAFKLRAVVVPLGMAVLLPQPFVRYQLFPVHNRLQNYKIIMNYT